MEFVKGGVPIKVAASVFGKGEQWVRVNMQNGNLSIGVVTGDYPRRNYYISPKLLYEQTGFLWKGEGYVSKS